MAEPPVAVEQRVPERTVVVPSFNGRSNLEALSARVSADVSALVWKSRP